MVEIKSKGKDDFGLEVENGGRNDHVNEREGNWLRLRAAAPPSASSGTSAGTASTGTGNVPPEGEPGPLKDGIDAGGGNVAGESSPMKSFAKVGIVPADDGRVTLVISASVSPSLPGAKVRVRSPGSLSSLSRL